MNVEKCAQRGKVRSAERQVTVENILCIPANTDSLAAGRRVSNRRESGDMGDAWSSGSALMVFTCL
jgi:hypothetical protein